MHKVTLASRKAELDRLQTTEDRSV